MRSTYCLSKAGAIRPVGRSGRLLIYEAEADAAPAALRATEVVPPSYGQ
jgi:hypothetical protein